MRIALAETAQADALQPLVGSLECLGALHAAEFEPRRNVGARGTPRHQRFGLEQVAGLWIEPGERRAEHLDASRRRLQ